MISVVSPLAVSAARNKPTAVAATITTLTIHTAKRAPVGFEASTTADAQPDAA